MNILLQNTETLQYVTPAAGWTLYHEGVRLFKHGLDVIFFCYNTGMPDMRLLFEFPDGEQNFSFPVTDHRGD